MSKDDQNWNSNYDELITRNIGLLTKEEQLRLKNARVSVFGVGGFGCTIFEILVRSGIENFSIVDNDVFEASNMNRQLFAFTDTLGEKKIETAKRWAEKINPNINVDIYDYIDEDNVGSILEGSDVAALVLDHFRACLTIARKAREMGITFVEGWAIPFANVCAFTPESATFEETYDLEEVNDISTKDIDEEQGRLLLLKLLFGFGKVEGVADYYSNETLMNLSYGIQPSFAPMVWLTANLIAIECIKVILKWGSLSVSPNFAIYDPFRHEIPNRMDDIPENKKEIVNKIL